MNYKEPAKRRDWQVMREKITQAFIELYREKQQSPTNAELAKRVGVSERTVVRHLKEINFSDFFSEQRANFAPLAGNVMMAIYNSAIKGSTSAQKLMLQIVFEWAEPKEFRLPEPTDKELTDEDFKKMERGFELLIDQKIRERGFEAKYGPRPGYPQASAS